MHNKFRSDKPNIPDWFFALKLIIDWRFFFPHHIFTFAVFVSNLFNKLFDLFSSDCLNCPTQALRRFARLRTTNTFMWSTLIGCGAVWSAGSGSRSSSTR